MAEASELKPCPWCKVPPECRFKSNKHFVRCVNSRRCPVFPRTVLYETVEKAIEAWNTRPEREVTR